MTLPAGTPFAQAVPRGHTAFAYVFEGDRQLRGRRDLGYRGDLDGELARRAARWSSSATATRCACEAAAGAVRFLLVPGGRWASPSHVTAPSS